MADAHSIEGLKNAAYNHALEFFYDVTQSQDYIDLSEKDVCEYLGDSFLSAAEEEDIWNKGLKWLQHSEDRLTSVMAVFSTIRLLDMDPIFLRNEMLNQQPIFSKYRQGEEYIKEVLDHIVYDLPRPTTLPPLPIRVNTNYTRELVVLGGETHSQGVCETGYFFNCVDSSFQKTEILALGRNYCNNYRFWEPSLDRPSGFPDHYNLLMACCEMGGDIYVSGYGKKKMDVWRYEIKAGTWQKFSEMLYPRENHCMLTGNKRQIYMLGGYHRTTETGVYRYQPTTEYSVLVGVEKHFSDSANEEVGELLEPIYSSAAVFYQGCIYLFGGKTKTHNRSDLIQCFNVRSRQCSILHATLPKPTAGIKPILYGNWIILLSQESVLVTQMEKLMKVAEDKGDDVSCQGITEFANQDKDPIVMDLSKKSMLPVSQDKGTLLVTVNRDHFDGNTETTNQNRENKRLTCQANKREVSPSGQEMPSKRSLKKRQNKESAKDSTGSPERRVIEIKANPSTSKLAPPSNKKSPYFIIKSGTGKERFGAELLGDCVCIVGGRERSNKGLFDYSACICTCPITDLINASKTDLEWISNGKLDSFMTVFMTTSVRIYRPKTTGDTTPMPNRSPRRLYSRSRSRSYSRSRSRSYSRSRSRSYSRSRSRSYSRSRSRSYSRSYSRSRSRSRSYDDYS